MCHEPAEIVNELEIQAGFAAWSMHGLGFLAIRHTLD
jgi:hypothetical protein